MTHHMRDSIYTIPVSEVFEPKCGCPICRMRDMLEQRGLEYIMGAAMMEPDVRIETNKAGFCATHFEMMLGQKNRLSLALMLESHLAHLRAEKYKDILTKAKAKPKKRDELKTINHSCFVCDKIDWAMNNMLSTVLKLYRSDAEFQRLFASQEYICLPHMELLAEIACDTLPKKELPAFLDALVTLTDKQMEKLNGEVSHFCKMFDYRNNGGDWGTSRDSIERAIAMLSTRDYREPEQK